MTASVPLSIAPREDQLWPTLTPAQIARIEKQGRRRAVEAGEVLMEAGQAEFLCFVVLDGELEVVRPTCDGDQLITTYRRGSISGENPAIEVRTQCQIAAVDGDQHLERVHCRNGDTASVEIIRHLFVMTGAVPATKWLDGCLTLDDRGFLKTGPDLTPEDLDAAQWPLSRPPHLLETSRPGVFAVGDVRGGNIKRVASAVGEGAIAVAFVHRVLQE